MPGGFGLCKGVCVTYVRECGSRCHTVESLNYVHFITKNF